jgi:hypothetical protein
MSRIRPMVKRPDNLSEVAAESATYEEFGYNLKDFLHTLAFAKKEGRPLEPLLVDAPKRLASVFSEGKICDAFLAATADYLARNHGILTPSWALEEDLVLADPWFSPPYLSVRMRLLRDTPSAFKDKNIFIFEDALIAV